MTELLAPAGSMDALRAAIANGANAVYLGGKDFSARAYADNFSIEEIDQAVRLAHFHHCKVYVAINTLVADEEIPAALLYAAELYKLGVDAVILQDIGLMVLLHRALPELPLHASTQMTVCNAPFTSWLEESGVERVILPREFSFRDIELFKNASSLQVEAFVHGALCICYSGQCLFSSMVGGRSGNRGRCAQPCRMAYQLIDEYGDKVDNPREGEHLLSPRDLFGYQNVRELHKLGLDSWKIEGRMKKPQYVATVSRIYSRIIQALDQGLDPQLNEEELRQLTQVFNRSHSNGYWQGNSGYSMMSYGRPNNRGVFLGRVVAADDNYITIKLAQPLHRMDGIEIWVSGRREGGTVEKLLVDDIPQEQAAAGSLVKIPALPCRSGDRVFKTYDAPLMEGAELSYSRLPDKPLQYEIKAVIGEKLFLAAYDGDGYRAEKESHYQVEEATGGQPARQVALAQLGRLGGTGYTMASLRGDIDPKAMLPTSILNHCRRELVESILAQRREADNRKFEQARFSAVMRLLEKKSAVDPNGPLPQPVVWVQDEALAVSAAKRGIKDIYVDAVGWSDCKPVDWAKLYQQTKDSDSRIIPVLPRIILPSRELHWQSQALQWQDMGCKAVMIQNIAQGALLSAAGWQGELLAGWGLNVYNSAACEYLYNKGFQHIMLSPELTLSQIEAIDGHGSQLELVVQGAAELMVSEHCMIGSCLGGKQREQGKLLSCSRSCRSYNKYQIRDEKGYCFPIRCDSECRMHIFNSRELCLLPELPELGRRGVSRIVLDLRLYENQHALRLVDLYRQACSDSYSHSEACRKMESLVKEYTRGHLHRGV